jgi:hypothetical protein
MLTRRPKATTHFLLLAVYSLLCWPASSFGFAESDLEPFIEKHTNGWIDWKNGTIYGIGRAYLSKNRNNRPLTHGTAGVVASGNIVKLASGLHLDDTATLEKLGGGKVSINLQAFIRDREVKSILVDNDGDPYIEVTKIAEMKGISGLTAKLLDYLAKDPVWRDLPIRAPEPTAKNEQDEGPWLLVDARSLPGGGQVQPALFPKIVSRDGTIVYSVREAEEQALVSRGMISYVSTVANHRSLRSETSRALRQLLGEASLAFGPGIAYADSITNSVISIPVPGPPPAEAPKPERKQRGKYIVVDAQNVDGLSKTNLVVNVEDAKTMKEEDASSQILKKCRVVVIVSSPIGGIEGSLPMLLADISSW